MPSPVSPIAQQTVPKDRAARYYFPSVSVAYEQPYKHLVLRWWTKAHDDLLEREISEQQWSWHPSHQTIVAITPPEAIAEFRVELPKVYGRVWYNAIVSFANARAFDIGLDKKVTSSPTWKSCAACSELFHETSAYLFNLGGIAQVDICTPCIKKSVFGQPIERMSKARVEVYLQKLADSLMRVPQQDFGNRDMRCLLGLPTPRRAAVVNLLKKRPSLGQVKEHYGTWLHALIESGVLADGTRRTARGTQCVANDGHVCLSLAEKTIDDLLSAHGLEHQREVLYPHSNQRFDFVMGDLHIEYFGLIGDAEYEAKAKSKLADCEALGIKLLPVYPKDLLDAQELVTKIKLMANDKNGKFRRALGADAKNKMAGC